MILFDLKCSAGHTFEAWFKDGYSYEKLRASGEIACPRCGVSEVTKAPMAPRVKRSRTLKAGEDPAAVKARKALLALRRHVEQNCDYVGREFAEEARKIYYGEIDKRNIYGEATEEESRSLEEEGIPFGRIPWLETADS